MDFVKIRSVKTGFPHQREYVPAYLEPVREMRPGLYNKNQIIKEIYPRLISTSQLTLGPIVSAWGVLYKTSVIKDNNLYFNEHILLSEDILFSAELLTLVDSFYFIGDAYCYHYCFNPKSISKSFQSKRHASNTQIMDTAHKMFDSYTEFDFKQQVLYLDWYCILNSLKEGKYLQKHERKKYFENVLNDTTVKKVPLCIDKVNVNYKQKLIMIMIKLRMSKLLVHIFE